MPNPEVYGRLILKVEEQESIKLKDYQQLSQEEAANKLSVSQSTFHRAERLLSCKKNRK